MISMRMWNPWGGQDTKQGPLADIHAKVERAKSAATERHGLWQQYQEFYDGERQRSKWISQVEEQFRDHFIVTNFTYSSLENYISVLMLATPDWFVVA